MPVYDLDPYQKLLALQIATKDLQDLPLPMPIGRNDPFSSAVRQGFNQPYDLHQPLVQQGIADPSTTTNRDVLMRLLDLSPGMGDAIAIDEGINELKQGNKGLAALNFASTIPAVGDFAKLAGVGGIGLLGLLAQMGRQTGKAPVTPFSKMAGVIGYHGSPHKFDQFDMSKIGTGEGAQAYGHGLYFAESPGVAKAYASQTPLADVKRQFLRELPEDADFDEVMDMVKSGQFSEQHAKVLRALEADDWLGFDYPSQAVSAAYSGKLSNWDASQALKDAVEGSSNLYKVDIPDQYVNNFLDWDKPLSEQPVAIRKAINNTFKGNPDYPNLNRYLKSDMAAKDFYRYLQTDMPKGSQELASKALNDTGIKGIRYLDQGSREAGKGTSNFVVFDDKIIKMLERK